MQSRMCDFVELSHHHSLALIFKHNRQPDKKEKAMPCHFQLLLGEKETHAADCLKQIV